MRAGPGRHGVRGPGAGLYISRRLRRIWPSLFAGCGHGGGRGDANRPWGGALRRVASNWAVMLASGSSSLLAMGPMPARRTRGAGPSSGSQPGAGVLRPLFGACTSWRLIISVLVMRRLTFVAATALVAVHSYGSLKRTQALFRAFDAPFILAPIGALGAYEDGTRKLYDDLPQEELACVGGAFLRGTSSTAATRRAHRTRTPSFSSSRC